MIGLLSLCFAWHCSAGGADVGGPPISRVHLVRPAPRALQPPNPGGHRVRVEFAQGRSTVTVAGEVRGYGVMDYVVAASGSQRLTVALVGGSRYLMLAVYTPEGEAVCVETCDRRWTGVVPRAGDYTIRVGLVRAEARREGRAGYTLRIGLTPSPITGPAR